MISAAAEQGDPIALEAFRFTGHTEFFASEFSGSR